MSDRTTSQAQQNNVARDEVAHLKATAEMQRQKFMELLPSNISWEEFRNAFMVAVQRNWRLVDADRQSLWLALQECAAAGLRPDGKEAALTIFGDDQEDEDGKVVQSNAKYKKKVVFMPMVWGLMRLVRNAQEVERVVVECAYKGEHIKIGLGDNPSFEHTRSTEPDFDDSYANLIGAYAIVAYKNGDIEREWMSRAKIERVRAVAKSKKGPWMTWPDEMARKSVLRRLFKRLSKSSVLQKVEAALDRDAGPEIEGRAEESLDLPAVPEPRAAAPKMVERAGPPIDIGLDRPAADAVSRQPVAKAAAAKPAAAKPAAAKPAAAQAEPERQPEPEPPEEDPFEAWCYDEFGNVEGEDGEPMTNVVMFAEWFARAASKTHLLEELKSHNMDGIGAAGAFEQARTIIADAIADAEDRIKRETAATAAQTQQEPPADHDEPEPDPAQYPEPSAEDPFPAEPVLLTNTAKGSPNWPKYEISATEELATLDTEGAIRNWERVNLATYRGKAIEPKIERRIRERLEAIGVTPPSPPLLERDRNWLNDQKPLLAAMKAKHEVEAWARSAIVASKAAFFKSQWPDAYAELKALGDSRLAELGG